ncbi:MAG: SMC-Scp complex subunit ScpB [Deltaproteobacteria bacterium]|nr:SMC-Scp complex subunit ScpB [Deltaproteobacteria bacterium]
MEQNESQKEKTKTIVECLIFTSEIPLTLDKIRDVIEDIPKKELKELIEELMQEHQDLKRGIFIREVAHGYQFCTRSEYAHWIQKLRKTKPYHLSQPTLETLAIIAYKQPLTRAEVEAITSKFLEVFGLENLASLPPMEEIGQLKDSDFPLFKKDTPVTDV